MIFLVRHAHAGDKRTWSGPDDTRPLSSTGRGEAAGLMARLGGFHISAVVSSPALRCVQTVDELASSRKLPVLVDQRLRREATADEVLEFAPYDGLVLCTHGEV